MRRDRETPEVPDDDGDDSSDPGDSPARRAGWRPEFARFEREAATPVQGWSAVGALLRAPGAVYRAIHERGAAPLPLVLLGALLAGTACYGLAMGALVIDAWEAAPLRQAAYVTLKLPLIAAATLFLCLPSFYVFNTLLGSRLTLGQSLAVLLCLGTPAAVLLASFAPIVWFFGLSTESHGFMIGLHVVLALASFLFGLACLRSARRYLAWLADERGRSSSLFLRLWVVIYVLVICQAVNFLRPYFEPGDFFAYRREFFVSAVRAVLAGDA